MAEGRSVVGYVVIASAPDLESAEECPECGFDTLLTFPCAVLSDHGVSTWPSIRVCARCWDAAHREGSD